MKALIRANGNLISVQSTASPLVTYAKGLEGVQIDRNAQVNLTRMAGLVEELRRSGLPATLHVWSINNTIHSDGKSFKTQKISSDISLNAQEMTPALKEICRYADVKGYRVNVVLPGSGAALEAPKSAAPTLGQVVERIAPPKAPPALPKPDAEQEKWAGGLAGAFNRLSAVVAKLDPNLQEAARPLMDNVRAVQGLCGEVRIANTRIGKVTQELDNVTEFIREYAKMQRLGSATPEHVQAVAQVFSVKAESIATRFAGDLKEIEQVFADRQKLLANDLI